MPEPRLRLLQTLHPRRPSRNGRRLAAAACGALMRRATFHPGYSGCTTPTSLSESAERTPAPRPGTFAAPIARRAVSPAILPIFAGSAFRAARAPLFQRRSASNPAERIKDMPTITTRDGTDIFYKDWGAGQPIVFSRGWPLSADDWDTQMLFFLGKGFRVVAHDRRGHGRSTQTGSGHDMDHYADDLAALTAHLDLKGAVHVGHSTGGGEVVHYLARHGESRVAKAAIVSAVPPLMVKTPSNPDGLPKEVLRGFRRSSPPTAPSSITMCRRDRSTATTGPARNPCRR